VRCPENNDGERGQYMRAKYKFQVVQDAVMLIMLLSLMGFHLWGEPIHEWLGIAFLCIILLHNGLNTHWFRKMFLGEYPVFRIIQLAMNLVLILLLLCAIVSGLMLSRHALPNVPIHSATDLVRKIHMTSVHWGQVLIAIHLGMHWKMLANFFCKIWHISPLSMFATRLMPAVFTCIAVYGGYAFVTRDMSAYLLIQVDFAFLDFAESKIMFYLDYLAIIISFAYLTRFLLWFLLFRRDTLHLL
jgi:hypothetical protein